MQYLIGIVLSLIGLYLYQSSKRKDAEANSLIANTKGQDSQLEKQEIDIKNQISEIDERLKAIKKQREEAIKLQDQMTMLEKAEAANKKFGGN